VSGSQLACGANYPDYAESWMIYGPFSLEGAAAAEMTYELWLLTQYGHDGLLELASVDGTNFYGGSWTGNSSGWLPVALDFADVYGYGSMLGRPQVWVAFVFVSDGDGVTLPEGGYVDDILIHKHLGGKETPGAAPAPVLPPGILEEPVSRSLER
jgi:hypothetical protein